MSPCLPQLRVQGDHDGGKAPRGEAPCPGAAQGPGDCVVRRKDPGDHDGGWVCQMPGHSSGPGGPRWCDEARGRRRDLGPRSGGRGVIRAGGRLDQAQQLDLLLLEIAAVLLVDQHQVEVVLDAELVVHKLIRRRQVVRGQEQPAEGHNTGHNEAQLADASRLHQSVDLLLIRMLLILVKSLSNSIRRLLCSGEFRSMRQIVND